MVEQTLHPGWARSLELERLAKMPHLLYKDAWEAKQQMVTLEHPHVFLIFYNFLFVPHISEAKNWPRQLQYQRFLRS